MPDVHDWQQLLMPFYVGGRNYFLMWNQPLICLVIFLFLYYLCRTSPTLFFNRVYQNLVPLSACIFGKKKSMKVNIFGFLYWINHPNYLACVLNDQCISHFFLFFCLGFVSWVTQTGYIYNRQTWIFQVRIKISAHDNVRCNSIESADSFFNVKSNAFSFLGFFFLIKHVCEGKSVRHRFWLRMKYLGRELSEK